jgi:hypothetical protein
LGHSGEASACPSAGSSCGTKQAADQGRRRCPDARGPSTGTEAPDGLNLAAALERRGRIVWRLREACCMPRTCSRTRYNHESPPAPRARCHPRLPLRPPARRRRCPERIVRSRHLRAGAVRICAVRCGLGIARRGGARLIDRPRPANLLHAAGVFFKYRETVSTWKGEEDCSAPLGRPAIWKKRSKWRMGQCDKFGTMYFVKGNCLTSFSCLLE